MPKPPLFFKLESVVARAEEIAAQSEDRWARKRIGGELIPALYDARTYVEVGHISAPEIRLALSKAALTAGDLADADPKFAPLLSLIRRLMEDASTASRPKRQ